MVSGGEDEGLVVVVGQAAISFLVSISEPPGGHQAPPTTNHLSHPHRCHHSLLAVARPRVSSNQTKDLFLINSYSCLVGETRRA